MLLYHLHTRSDCQDGCEYLIFVSRMLASHKRWVWLRPLIKWVWAACCECSHSFHSSLFGQFCSNYPVISLCVVVKLLTVVNNPTCSGSWAYSNSNSKLSILSSFSCWIVSPAQINALCVHTQRFSNLKLIRNNSFNIVWMAWQELHISVVCLCLCLCLCCACASMYVCVDSWYNHNSSYRWSSCWIFPTKLFLTCHVPLFVSELKWKPITWFAVD